MKAALQEDASSGDGHRAQERTHARTIQKLDYRHPMSSEADFSASVNMLRGLSQIFFLLLLFGKLRPVSTEQNTFGFSHDMILNWRLLESSFAHTLTRFGCTTQTRRAPDICCRWARYWTRWGIFVAFMASLTSSRRHFCHHSVFCEPACNCWWHWCGSLIRRPWQWPPLSPSSVSIHSCLQRRSMWTHAQAGTHLDISSHSQAALVSDCWEQSQGISQKFLPARLRGDGDCNCDGFI